MTLDTGGAGSDRVNEGCAAVLDCITQELGGGVILVTDGTTGAEVVAGKVAAGEEPEGTPLPGAVIPGDCITQELGGCLLEVGN